MAVKPITISFKNTPSEIELYNWIINHSNYSGFIKDILKAAKDSDGKENKSSVEKKETGLIEMDF